MKVCCVYFLVLLASISYAQLPPRLNIPGAVLLNQGRPIPYRQQQKILLQEPQPVLRVRKPIPVRPVIEENEDPPAGSGTFEDEVSRLGLSALQSAVRQAEEEPTTRSAQIQFRPERPIPVLREDIRENYPSPRPIQTARPILRQPTHEEAPRQQIRQQRPLPPPQRAAPARLPPRPANDEEEDYAGRKRKPVVQILRKYRTDNPDGSITWGFENEDGTFKEETIGVDCIIRGKYGYVDPDGVKREYSYESGNPCDPVEEEEEDLPPLQGAGKSQLSSRNQPRPQPQLRPLQVAQQYQ